MAKKKRRIMKVSEDFYNLMKIRSKNFNSSMAEETENMATLTNTLGMKFGFDPKKVPVVNHKKAKLNFQKRILIFK